MSASVTSYQVRRATEEAQCEECGNPIYMGETAYESEAWKADRERRASKRTAL